MVTKQNTLRDLLKINTVDNAYLTQTIAQIVKLVPVVLAPVLIENLYKRGPSLDNVAALTIDVAWIAGMHYVGKHAQKIGTAIDPNYEPMTYANVAKAVCRAHTKNDA